MKPCLLLIALLSLQTASPQSLDYISVRKKNGRVVKNVYAGSRVTLQTTDGGYLQGPVQAIRNDSLFVVLYDVRTYATNIGSFIRDTVSTSLIGIHHRDITRIHLGKRTGFWGRTAAPLLMIGGAGYAALNVLNGAFFNQPVTGGRNLRTLGIAAGAFGLGYLLHKLLATDGFSKRKHVVVYVNL